MLELIPVNMLHTSRALMIRLPLMAELLLLFLLAWLLVDLWQGVPEYAGPSAGDKPVRVMQLPELAKLTAVSLFGKKQPEHVAEPKTASVANSPLHIQLLGLVQAGDQSAAIIKRDGQQHVYFVGEQIQAGVILHAVDGDALIIKRNGKMEKVTMQKRPALATMHAPPAMTGGGP